MEALEDLAEKEPQRVQIIKKAAATKLIKDGDAVIGVEYTHDGKTFKEYGPVVLATGAFFFRDDLAEFGADDDDEQVVTQPTFPRMDSSTSTALISCTSLPRTETTGAFLRSLEVGETDFASRSQHWRRTEDGYRHRRQGH